MAWGRFSFLLIGKELVRTLERGIGREISQKNSWNGGGRDKLDFSLEVRIGPGRGACPLSTRAVRYMDSFFNSLLLRTM